MTSKNHQTVECFRVIEVSVSHLSKAVSGLLIYFFFIGVSCIYSCLKLKFACLRPAHVLRRRSQICWRGRNRTGASLFVCLYSSRTSCTYTFHSSRSSSSWSLDVMKETLIMIDHDKIWHVCESECKIACAGKNVIFSFFFH